MSTLIHRRVQKARAGENPKVIRRVCSGWNEQRDRPLMDKVAAYLDVAGRSGSSE